MGAYDTPVVPFLGRVASAIGYRAGYLISMMSAGYEDGRVRATSISHLTGPAAVAARKRRLPEQRRPA